MSTKARSLADQFQKGITVSNLKVAYMVLQCLKQLNIVTLISQCNCVQDCTSSRSWKERTDAYMLQSLFKEANSAVEICYLEEIIAPRIRRLPVQLTGPAPAHQTANAEECFTRGYYEVIDSALMQLSECFHSRDDGLAISTWSWRC